MAKNTGVSAQMSVLSTELVPSNRTVIDLPAFRKQEGKANSFFYGCFSGYTVSGLSAIVGAACLADAFAVGPFLIVGSGVSFLSAIVCGKASSIFAKPILAAQKAETANLKRMLLANFGRNAGITEAIVTRCVMKNHQWTYNDEIFTVRFDEASGEYSFSRQDFFGVEAPEVSDAFLAELKPLMLKLKAADFSGESAALMRGMVSVVSQLVQSDLDVEQKHEVKRLVVDAGELLRISSDLAVFDELAAEAKLAEGLRALSADATVLAAEKRDVIARQLDSYNSYVGARSM